MNGLDSEEILAAVAALFSSATAGARSTENEHLANSPHVENNQQLAQDAFQISKENLAPDAGAFTQKHANFFVAHYSREKEITQKIEQEKEHFAQKQVARKTSSAQQSSSIAPTAPNAVHSLNEEMKHDDIVLILENAKKYQYQLTKHFLETIAAANAARQALAMKNAMTAADHPNMLEQLATEVENDHNQLAIYQKSLDEVENEIAILTGQVAFDPQVATSLFRAQEAKNHVEEAIQQRSSLIEKSVTLTKEISELIKNKKAFAEIMAPLKEKKWESLKIRAASIEAYNDYLKNNSFEDSKIAGYIQFASESSTAAAQESQLNKQAVAWLLRSAELRHQAAHTWSHDPNDQEKATWLNNVGACFFKAAQESQKPTPNQQVVAWILQAGELYQQAAQTWSHNLNTQKKATWLNDAGTCLHQAALEKQKPTPNQQVVPWLLRSAELRQQAAQTWSHAPNTQKKATWLNDAGDCFYQAALENQKPRNYQQIVTRLLRVGKEPSPQIVTWYFCSADLYQQAAQTWSDDPVHQQKAVWLKDAGACFYRAALEKQKPKPNEQIIAWVLHSADLYQQAIQTWSEAPTDQQKATCLSNAGVCFYQAALESQQLEPYKQDIAWLLRRLQKATLCFSRPIEENQEPHQQIIAWILRSGELCQQAAQTWSDDPNDQEKATCLNDAGTCFYQAAEESQKSDPNKQAAASILRSGELYQQAAQTWSTDPNDQKKARYLNNAGVCCAQVAEENQKPEPNQQVIEWLLRAGELYQQAAQTWSTDPNTQKKATCFNKAGICFAQAAQESQKLEPNKEAIEQKLKEAEDFLNQTQELAI